jgi:CHASE3 domain sensor protein
MSFEDPHGALLERRRIDPTIEMIAHKVVNMEHSLDKLTEAITKLAVIEEKQTTDRAALERAFMAIQKSDERCTMMCEKITEKLEKIELRTDTLEHAAPANAQVQQWVTSAVWAAAGLAAYVVVHKMGLLG